MEGIVGKKWFFGRLASPFFTKNLKEPLYLGEFKD